MMDVDEEATEDQFEGNKVIRGQLKSTKGNQLIVNDVILIIEKPEDRQKLEQTYFKKRLELKGDVYLHRCDPDEQCPEEGYFRYMRNIEYPVAEPRRQS